MVRRKLLFNVFLVILIVTMTGCSRTESARHNLLMKGQILEATDSSAYLCIGSKDGAEAGDQFVVYKFTRVANTNQDAPHPQYEREQVGRIKITEIVDEHMAKAKIISGEVKANYFVELEGGQ